ncbi:hypothetical protein PFMALIP_06100 [Plasmodium falciparum MaliPS096_E11]|uniref:Surface antigen n=1 Tax=Plasmodium falciparum MaliPS096_E11 TaxID=1036727 RepID=A0A024WGM8_PLAFA|nr:hypothetical protein PFMALIP_06100 [Plasmodium falciparum MaliPS096_E11]
MKEVMDNFNKQTQQRFHEYDERMKTIRQKCREQCDKEIQKIILKDKIEKELTEKFSSLHTDIKSDAIPTCICEKSVADKVEKTCLRCGSILGAAMPEVGSIGGGLLYALNQWKSYALLKTTKYALAKGAAQGAIAGNAQGVAIVLSGLNKLGIKELYPELLESIGTEIPYYDIANIANAIITKKTQICNMLVVHTPPICSKIDMNFSLIKIGNQPHYPTRTGIEKGVTQVVGKAKDTADFLANKVSSETSSKIITEETDVINTIYMSNQTAIIASIIAIVIIVLIMVIIYLILRYRRKKKMKKKLQYIKLLEE